MKKTNQLFFIVFVFVLSNSFFSCSSKRVGFFNNTYPQYSVKTKDQNYTSSAKALSAENNKVLDHNKTALINDLQNVETSQDFSTIEEKSQKVASKNNLVIPVVKLTREEKKEVKKDIKENFNKNSNNETDLNPLILVIIAILLPPVAVALVDGIGGPFVLSIFLTLLFYLPGLIYALWRIFR